MRRRSWRWRSRGGEVALLAADLDDDGPRREVEVDPGDVAAVAPVDPLEARAAAARPTRISARKRRSSQLSTPASCSSSSSKPRRHASPRPRVEPRSTELGRQEPEPHRAVEGVGGGGSVADAGELDDGRARRWRSARPSTMTGRSAAIGPPPRGPARRAPGCADSGDHELERTLGEAVEPEQRRRRPAADERVGAEVEQAGLEPPSPR